MKITEHRWFWPILLVLITLMVMVGGDWYTHKLRAEQPWGEEFVPGQWTASSYSQLQVCADRPASIRYRDIKWMVGDDSIPGIYSDNTHATLGAFDVYTNTIRINREYQYSVSALNHEMMHAVLAPLAGHPEFAFNEKCNTIFK